MLITKLKSLFSGDATGDETVGAKPLELACAALMFEVVRADFAVDEAEQRAVYDLLTAEFNLSPEEIESVTEEAASKAAAATAIDAPRLNEEHAAPLQPSLLRNGDT